jgi:hypothetical protein
VSDVNVNVGEPLWWLQKLKKSLDGRRADLEKMNDYYEGNHPLPFLTKAHDAKMRNEFKQLLEDSRSNFMELVVDAVAERLKVEGFRLSAASDAVSDKDTWEIWQANQMDAESQTAFAEALVKGMSYLSVWEGDDYPTIAVEDPLQTIVGYVPGSNFRLRAAALKEWTDDWTGMMRANVYMPDGIYKFERRDDGDTGSATDQRPWQELTDKFVRNKLGVVPIVPLRNRPRLLTEGRSELANVYRMQNSINGFNFLLALAGYFGAHRQRWAIGITLMEDENGKPKEPFDVAIDRLWTSQEAADEAGNPVKFGEFSQTDLEPYIKAIEQKVLHIATTSRTPRHYLFQEGQSPSGDAIESAEAGLVKKVVKAQGPFGEGLEEALRLARRFAGKTDAPVDSEIVWANAATESKGVKTDAVIKQYGEGLIPWEAALEELGYTQTQIERFSTMRLADALVQGIANPNAPTPTQVNPPTVRG